MTKRPTSRNINYRPRQVSAGNKKYIAGLKPELEAQVERLNRELATKKENNER